MFSINKIRLAAIASVGVTAIALSLPAAAGPAGNSASMSRARGTIVQAAVGSRDHTTLVAAVTAAGLADTLSGPGPFTVFAPTNAAFGRLPAGTVDTLLQPANRDALQSVLTYHVVAGRVTAADLVRRIRAGRGSARLTTVQGGMLTARMRGGNVVIVDAKGGIARVTRADLAGSNGVIHVTDAVSIPG